MSIKLTYSRISQNAFSSALQRLTNAPMNPKLAYEVKKIVDDIVKTKKKIAKEYEDKLITNFTKKNDSGGFDILEDKKDEFNKQEELFGLTETTIERNAIPLSALMQAGVTISPSEINAIEPMLVLDSDTTL